MPASLIALCFGNFIIGTGTLIVPGMLPVLAEAPPLFILVLLALGTAAGGVLLSHVSGIAGYTHLSWISVPLFATALALSAFAARRARV